MLIVAVSAGAVERETTAASPAEVTITVEASKGPGSLDVKPRAVVVCDQDDLQLKPDCSDEIIWKLDAATEGLLGANEEIEIVYKPVPPDPYVPGVFRGDPPDDLRIGKGTGPIYRRVKSPNDLQEYLGDLKLVVWRYKVILKRDGQIVDEFDPRVIIDRTR